MGLLILTLRNELVVFSVVRVRVELLLPHDESCPEARVGPVHACPCSIHSSDDCISAFGETLLK